MQETIQNLIKEALKNLNIESGNIVVEHPADLKMGDYSTNVAMVCFSKLKDEVKADYDLEKRNQVQITFTRQGNKNETPKDLAETIVAELNKNIPKEIQKVEVAGAGFINFYLSREFFGKSIEDILNQGENLGKNSILKDKKIMVEYTDPNPFKPIHIGHLMTNAIGESISRIVGFSGAEILRANYQGDVGLHVAKAIYGLIKNEKFLDKTVSYNVQATNIGQAYVFGAGLYESDEEAKKEINEINKKIYEKSDEKINKIYDWGFKATMDAFEDLYKMLGTKFDYYFLESQMMDIGKDIVRDNMGKVFEESDGAIVFKAEKLDPKLHTRVFITSKGIPSYETKELGLTNEKFRTSPQMDLSIVITANEQADYMRVVTKAISLIHPEYEKKMLHITHGMMRLVSGKMGSRKGNVVTGESLINDARQAIEEKIKDRDFTIDEKEKIVSSVSVAALKYSILKQSTGGDVVFDFEKSISFDGDSGPYLQYSYTRAKSVLEKAQKENILPDFNVLPEDTFEIEKLLYRFPSVVSRASVEYEPHYIANYLTDVARAYNSFYGNNIIVKTEDKRSAYKVALTYAFTFVMKNGLYLLGIQVPDRM